MHGMGWLPSRAIALVMLGLIAVGCEKESVPRAEPVTKESAPSSTTTNSPAEPALLAAVAASSSVGQGQAAAANPDSSAALPGNVAPKLATNNASMPPTVPTVNASAAAAPAASETAAPAIATTSAAPEIPPPPPVESPKQSAQAFSVWLQSSGKYTAGQQGTVEAVVVPKAEFHCNSDYPYKFVTSAGSSGVSYPKPTVRSEGLSVSTSRAVMRVPFVPQNTGDAKVGGTFHFSVCSDSQCVVEKRDVFVTVKVQ